jgi:hypothetical protein
MTPDILSLAAWTLGVAAASFIVGWALGDRHRLNAVKKMRETSGQH